MVIVQICQVIRVIQVMIAQIPIPTVHHLTIMTKVQLYLVKPVTTVKPNKLSTTKIDVVPLFLNKM